MSKIIAISNQKGGTGKTTTAVNLGIGLVNEGKKVLLIDYDAQGSLTQCLGYPNPDELSVTISSLMEKVIREQPVLENEGILHHKEGVDFIPANIELSGMETALVNIMSRERVLKDYLATVKDNYDYVLIDCTPSLGMLTINALTAANEVIIPVQSHFLPAKGLEQLLGTVAKVKRQINPALKINGILLTMVDGRTNLARDISQLIRNTYGNHIKVFKTDIPLSIKAAETSAVGKSIYSYDKNGRVADAYRNLTKEVMNNEQRTKHKSEIILLNGNGFILGVSGSGKSFAAKMEILMSALFSNDDIIVIDVEREYGSLIRNLGGEVITLSTSSKNHINALEINNDIDMDENPVSIKSEFLISLFDQLLKSNDSRLGGGVGAKDKSIIDRCAIKVYGEYLSGKSEYMPTLVDFRNELLRQPEDEAQDLALSLEIFTTGSLDAFAHQSDVNTNNRIVAYDILELGEQMKSIGLLIMLDNIFNRVMANRRRGKYTRVYVDEAHLYFKSPYSADFLLKCWKRFRKYGGLLTGITQNVSDCLLNETARGMLSNSEFLLLLNQAPSDRKDLSELLSISDTQMSYITNAGAGRGLIKVGGSIVPFINEFPTDTELYKLMSTKLSE